MTNTKKVNGGYRLFLVMLLITIISSSCNPRAHHLMLDLENSGTPGQRPAQTQVAFTQTPGQASNSVPSVSQVIEPTEMLVAPILTQEASATFSAVLIPTSSPILSGPTATAVNTTSQAGTPTPTPTPTRTATATLTQTRTPAGPSTQTRTPVVPSTQTRTATATLTQTRTSAAPSTLTHTPASTLTATATPTKTATLTQTSTPTPTLQTGWAGEWKVSWQMDDGNYVEGTISVGVSGTDFTASGAIGGINYTFTGIIVDQELTAFGSWTSPTSNGSFIWQAVGDGQFGGSRDLDFGFCGAREGSDLPEPCYVPPLY